MQDYFIGKKILRGFAYFFIGVFTLATTVLLIFSSCWTSKDSYARKIYTEQFDVSVSIRIEDALDEISSIVEIPQKKIMSALGSENIINYVHDYLNHFIDCTLKGKEFTFADFESKNLRPLVEEEIQPFIEDGSATAADIDEVTDYILSTVNDAIHILPSIVTVNASKVSGYISKNMFLNKITPFVCALNAALVLITLSLGSKEHFVNRLFSVCSSMWIPISTILAPFAIISAQKLISSLALTKTTLYYFISGVYDNCILTPLKLLIASFVLLSLIIIASAIIISFRKKHSYVEHRTYTMIDFNEETK